MSLNDLREALAAAGVAPLIAKQIDLNLLEYERRYSPLVRIIPTEPWGTNQYFFNTRSARPSGGFVQDGGARPVATSTYSQSSFNIRNMQTVGAVTGFAQAVTRDVIGDLKSREVDGAIQSLLWDIENAIIWGNEPATYNSTTGTLGQYPQFSGLAFQVNSFSGATQNAIDEAATSALTLAMLDEVKDLAEENAAMPVQGEQWMWVMGPRAKTKIDQLLVNQQRFEGTIEVAAGLIVNSYAGIPIIKSSFLSPRTQVMATPSVATSQSASNPVGSLAAGARYYRIGSIVQRFGEIAGCVEFTVTVGAGGAGIVTISSIVAPNGPDGAQPLLYTVYEGGTGAEKLIGVVDAFDTTGAATTTIIDTGTCLLTNSLANSVQTTAYVGAPSAGTLSARNTYMEDIYLVPRDTDFLLRPYVRDVTPINLAPTVTAPDTLPFALVTDTCLATRGPKYLARLANVTAGI